jgi:hypothetical protein
MRYFFVSLVISLFACATVHAVDIERPKVEIVDKLNVNLATGQVTQTFRTVSIGGAMGLSHSISVYANELDFRNNWGFSDKYWVKLRYLHLTSPAVSAIPEVLRVSDGFGSADFQAYVNGSPVQAFRDTPPPYTYMAVGDERNSLVSNNDELIWTKPDGTVVKFSRAPNAAAGAEGNMKEITYPNGFQISIDWAGLQSVRTNTGFELKYLYEADNRPMDKPDNPILINAPTLGAGTPLTSANFGFSQRNPRYIKAINNAYEYCAPAAATCSLTYIWPTAGFEWPPGMPRTMYIGDSQARITSPEGEVTKFDFHAYDLSVDDDAFLNPVGVPVEPLYAPNTEFSPRLIGITLPSSTTPTYAYDFKTKFNYGRGCCSVWAVRAQTAGVIKSARFMDKSVGYTMLRPYDGATYLNDGVGGGVNHVLMSIQSTGGNPDVISYADTEEGTMRYDIDARNFPYRFESRTDPWQSYEYTRSNLSKISSLVSAGSVVISEASYPASCTPDTLKICNQANWIKDANGNPTYYYYHAPSGQVASVKSPADKNGISPQVRYEYTQLSAHYYNGGSSKITGTPIWMKTAERTCISSNTTYDPSAGSGSCNGGVNDEVVTRYEYNNDNLFMTGMTVTAWDGAAMKTLRTCFQYDPYGNQIGKTQPNANLSACN